jgi:hypothetical protein
MPVNQGLCQVGLNVYLTKILRVIYNQLKMNQTPSTTSPTNLVTYMYTDPDADKKGVNVNSPKESSKLINLQIHEEKKEEIIKVTELVKVEDITEGKNWWKLDPVTFYNDFIICLANGYISFQGKNPYKKVSVCCIEIYLLYIFSLIRYGACSNKMLNWMRRHEKCFCALRLLIFIFSIFLATIPVWQWFWLFLHFEFLGLFLRTFYRHRQNLKTASPMFKYVFYSEEIVRNAKMIDSATLRLTFVDHIISKQTNQILSALSLYTEQLHEIELAYRRVHEISEEENQVEIDVNFYNSYFKEKFYGFYYGIIFEILLIIGIIYIMANGVSWIHT